jgi:hypothetical protein
MNSQEILRISIASYNFVVKVTLYYPYSNSNSIENEIEQLYYNMHNYTAKCTKLKLIEI